MNIFLRASIVSLVSLSAFVAGAADWPRWRGPELNGISRECDWQSEWPASGPRQAWKASVGTGFSSFAVSQGRVYTMGNTQDADNVFCFDAASGRVLWKHSYACPLNPKNFEGGPCATPTVDGDRIYTFSRNGELLCLNAKDGSVVWSKNASKELSAGIPTWGLAGSVLIDGDLLCLNLGSRGAAFEKKTGKVVWSSNSKPGGYATPVPVTAGAEQCLALFSGDSLVVVKRTDGTQVCSYPWKTMYDVNAADPLFFGDKVFISAGYNHGGALLKFDGKTLEKMWENKNMRNHFNSCVLWQEHLYGVDENQLRCIAADTGTPDWSDREFGKGSVMLADGKLIGLSEKGELIVAPATPTAFKPVSRAKVLSGKCWTVPVLANGRIYCRNAAGDVVCLDVSGKQAARR